MNKRENKGITLIALVITIIVLLILAGISIATLLGGDGLLNKANEAKNKTSEAEAEEIVKLAIAGSYDKTGSMNTDEVEKKLNKEGGFTGSIPGTIKFKGYEFEIEEDGTITNLGEEESFNAEEWDKIATSEDCFIWGSDTKGEERYNTIVGYKEKLDNNTRVKIPSRAHVIDVSELPSDEAGRAFLNEILEIELPSTLTEIGDFAFGGDNNGLRTVEKITIPDSVTSIGDMAFRKCTSLREITIPDSVTSIGSGAFWGCNSLKAITIPDSIVNIEENAFNDCTELVEITIPDSVTSIGGGVFYNCMNLREIIIPESVTDMGYYVFFNCGSLTKIKCRALSKPEGWDTYWNAYYNEIVTWGYTGE